MTRAEQYRVLAARLAAKASSEPSPSLSSEWEDLAQSYARLATQWDETCGRPNLARTMKLKAAKLSA
jgi:hypothetical protein